MQKIFFIHVPKAAGSSINRYFSSALEKSLTHATEHQISEDALKDLEFVSGHIPYSKVENAIDIDQWVTVAAFREPYAYAVSHICWVRRLADPGEKKRFEQHPKIFQDVARKMAEFDFSKPEDIRGLCEWFDSINFRYLYNSQLQYLYGPAGSIKDDSKAIQAGLQQLDKIDLVGCSDDMSGFKQVLDLEFGFSEGDDEMPRENVSANKYGLDLHDEETRAALEPFVFRDIAIYQAAKGKLRALKEKYLSDPSCEFRGSIGGLSDKLLTGWVVDAGSAKHKAVQLLVDDKVVDEQLATGYRSGVKKSGSHPTGRCGFCFELQRHGVDELRRFQVRVKDCVDSYVPYSKPLAERLGLK